MSVIKYTFRIYLDKKKSKDIYSQIDEFIIILNILSEIFES